MRHARPLFLMLALSLTLPPSAVAAQGDDAGPDASAAKAALEGLIPTQLGGQVWEELVVQSGPESQAELDPNDESDAEQIAETEAMLTELGASIDDVTTASASLQPEDGAFMFLSAIQIAGVPAERILEVAQPSMLGDLSQPRIESAQVAGKDVTRLYEDAAPEFPPFILYPSGEIVWILGGPEALVAEALGQLP